MGLPPPGSSQYQVDDKTYPGYGHSPSNWLTADGQTAPGGWYAGKEYDNSFVDESNMGPTAGWTSGTDPDQIFVTVEVTQDP